MAITKSEIIAAAFTRNVSEEHILDVDITVAVKKFVAPYIVDTSDSSAIYDDYVKPVISIGVAVLIVDRIAAEISDRGIVQMVNTGASTPSDESKKMTKDSYNELLRVLIELMVEAAEEEGMELVDDDIEYNRVSFTGTTKQGIL